METVNQIPRWFWIAIGVIVIATIASVLYCNSQKVNNETALKQTLGTQLNAEAKQDVFDSINAIQNMMKG